MYPLSLRNRVRELYGRVPEYEITVGLGITKATVKTIVEGREERPSKYLNPKVMEVYHRIREAGPVSFPSLCASLGYDYNGRLQANEAVRYLTMGRLITREGHLYQATGKTWDDERILSLLDRPMTVDGLAEELGIGRERVWKGLAELEAIGAAGSTDAKSWEATA